MGILGDLKKIFFGAESLGKSAAGKGKDLAKETREDLLERASDFGDTFKSTASTVGDGLACLLYTSPSPRDRQKSRMPSSA